MIYITGAYLVHYSRLQAGIELHHLQDTNGSRDVVKPFTESDALVAFARIGEPVLASQTPVCRLPAGSC